MVDLIPYINNARTHSDSQVSQIAASIKEFDFNNPVLSDGKNGIISGHGRILAAKKLGLETVPVIELSHLSEIQKRAYILAENKLAENAGWDDELVQVELEALSAEDFDISLTGFDFEMPDFQPAGEDEQGRLDELDPIMIKCPHCGEDFDTRQA